MLVCSLIALSASLPSAAHAQRADSARSGVSRLARTVPPDTARKNMISPRRAFLTSLVLPGTMQLRLGRPKAAAIFLVTEAATVAMTAKSWNDLDKAKAARRDTVGTPVVDAVGKPVIDSVTGVQKVTYAFRNPNLVGRIRARRTHLEDWVAAIIFNHLFAGADAYVAANLQDFKANVQANATDRGVQLMARVAW